MPIFKEWNDYENRASRLKGEATPTGGTNTKESLNDSLLYLCQLERDGARRVRNVSKHILQDLFRLEQVTNEAKSKRCTDPVRIAEIFSKKLSVTTLPKRRGDSY